MRLTKAQAIAMQSMNEEACRIFGHLPEHAKKPSGFGELSNTQSMTCSRCEKKISL